MAGDLSVAAIRNMVPGKYRGVAVADVAAPLDEAALIRWFRGKPAYRRTRFIVARSAGRTAIVRVRRDAAEPLFAPITDVEVLATPGECAYLHCPGVDTAIPSALARAAADGAPDSRAVVVQGRYEHVNFIIGPAPLRVTVREMTPPEPPKLLDQARRVLDVTEDLPPIDLVPDVVRLAELAARRPAGRYLVPCRGSGFDPPGAETCYLDERPPQQPWTMIGCERSQQIHENFYGARAEQVDICPLSRPGVDGPLLTKCCLFENGIEVSRGQAIVPWGASLAQVGEGLRALASAWEPSWTPA